MNFSFDLFHAATINMAALTTYKITDFDYTLAIEPELYGVFTRNPDGVEFILDRSDADTPEEFYKYLEELQRALWYFHRFRYIITIL